MQSHVTMFEIAGSDTGGGSLARFYAEAVGLTSTPHPEDPLFGFVPAGEGSIAGFVVGASAFDAVAYAVFYIQVEDVDRVVVSVEAQGGRVLAGPFAYGPVRAAHVADPAGNRFGVFSGDPT